jgi:D-xylose transport system permease protein
MSQAGAVALDPADDQEEGSRSFADAIRAADIDSRLVGMVVALIGISVLFNVLTGGTFLTPRNLWNLTVQMSSTAIMATGMVLVIVSRNIDLSVGSMLGFIGMVMALVQAEILPRTLGFGHPMIWVITLAVGIALGAAIGAFQGSIVAYLGVPAFVVTLGGLLVWRGAAFVVSSGRTIAPMDVTFRRMGGGADGALGGTVSWVVAVLACIAIVLLIVNSRRQRQRFELQLRPRWAEVAIGVASCGAVLGITSILNSYYLPEGLAREFAEQRGLEWPASGLRISVGFAYPVVIMLGVALVMTYLASRRRFGRYVYAIGGNPEAAALGGINTKWMTVKVFMLMGVLVAVAAAVSIGRQNSGTVQLGTTAELYVIAAAVIGGTSLAGGAGTVAGAVLGAALMQALQSGMVLTGVDSPQQQIVVGVVLVLAVILDVIYRRRSA